MSGVNKVMILGNLGRDPEIKFLDGGNAVVNFSLAVNESWKNKDGEKQERTEWVRIVAWGKLAELCGEYLKKGRQAFVEGKMQTRKYQDKSGAEKQVTEVVASNVTFVGSSRSDAPAANAPSDDINF